MLIALERSATPSRLAEREQKASWGPLLTVANRRRGPRSVLSKSGLKAPALASLWLSARRVPVGSPAGDVAQRLPGHPAVCIRVVGAAALGGSPAALTNIRRSMVSFLFGRKRLR